MTEETKKTILKMSKELGISYEVALSAYKNYDGSKSEKYSQIILAAA